MELYSPEDSARVSASYLKRNPRYFKPNLVILGAGASIQAFPNGDKNGRKLPSMADLCKVAGIEKKLAALGIDEDQSDFEAVYSRLCADRRSATVLREIEDRIRDYFSDMKLPEYPTLYDHLLLSLRPHDLVATFNWDPLLFDSWMRLRDVHSLDQLPEIAFLHGNVRVGYCLKDKQWGWVERICPYCDQQLKPMPLLYPIGSKDYESDIFVRDAWQRLRGYLEEAFSVTIFGYSAPSTDQVAFETMRGAWKQAGERQFETIFIIDTKQENEIVNTWSPFLFSQHFKIEKDFYRSLIPRFARRTIEALFVPTVEGKFVEEVPIPHHGTWEELIDWYRELVRFENVISG